MKSIFSLFIMCLLTCNNLFAQYQNSRSPQGNKPPRGSQSTNAQKFVRGEFVAKLKEGVQITSGASLVSGRAVKVIKVGKSSFVVIKSNMNLAQLRNSADNSKFEYVEPNYIYTKQGVQTSPNLSLENLNEGYSQNYYNSNRPEYVPADEYFKKLWGLYNSGTRSSSNESPKVAGADIDALSAWKITKGDKKVIVAVIDTGIDYNHPELKGNMWVNTAEANGTPGVDDDNNGVIDDVHGAAFLSGKVTGNPMDDDNHGTHCAGTIAASHNEQGVAGVMANARLMAIKFLSADGSGTLADAVQSIDYATKMGAHIMSNSWGGGGFSKLMEDAIKEANTKGVVFIAAAGNMGSNNDKRPNYPSNYQIENVIAVAAHDINDKLAKFSSYGEKTVHVAAPGVEILSTVASGMYATFSGTSMATPHVSGIVGLMLTKLNAKNRPNLVTVIKNSLIKTAVLAPAYNGKVVSGGRASSAKAINAALNNSRNNRFASRN